MAQDYTLNVNVKGVDKAIGDVNNLTESIEEAAEATQEVGKGGGEGFKKLSSGLSSAKKGFTALRGAIIATGVGALVALLGALVSKLMENKKVMEVVEKATAGLGAVFGVIMDAVMPLGDMLLAAFNNPRDAITGMKDTLMALGDYIGTLIEVYFTPLRLVLIKIKEGALSAAVGIKEFFGGDATNLRNELQATQQDFADLQTEFGENLNALAEPFVAAGNAIAKMTEKATEAADAAIRLKDSQQALRDSNRQLEVDYARAAASIEELKMKRDDERLSLEERSQAARDAAALDAEFAKRRIEAADQEAALLRREISLQGETEERLDALRDAEIAASDARAASAAVQTELMTSLYGIEQERLTQAQDVAAFERELAAERMTEREAEKQAARDQLTERLETIEQLKIAEEEKEALRVKARENADALLLDLQNKFNEEDRKLQEDADAKEKERTKKQEDAIMAIKEQARSSTFDILKNLTAIAEKDTEESAKKAFNRNKAISIAETLVNTYMAAQKAYASQIIPLDPTSVIRAQIAAGIAVASGLAKVAAIKSTQFTGGGGGGSATGGSIGGGGGGIQSVGVDVGSLVPNQQTPTPEPVRAYVVENEISNKQALNRELQIQTTL